MYSVSCVCYCRRCVWWDGPVCGCGGHQETKAEQKRQKEAAGSLMLKVDPNK